MMVDGDVRCNIPGACLCVGDWYNELFVSMECQHWNYAVAYTLEPVIGGDGMSSSSQTHN